jgi:hypothetical protein
MADPKHIETLVEQAVDTVLNGILPTLREQLKRHVLRALEPVLAETTGAASLAATAGEDDTEKLHRALAAVQAGSSQVEILDAMIEGASKFASRSALYVVRGASAVGWKARGFADNEIVRSAPLELSEGLAAKAIGERVNIAGPCADFMPGFDEKLGAAAEGCMVLPLLVRDKVVAILYVDGGLEQHQLDSSAVQALVKVTGLWLEVFATRKAGGATAAAAAASGASLHETPVIHEPAARASAPVSEPSLQEAPETEPPATRESSTHEPAAVSSPSVREQPATPTTPPAKPTGEDGEVHKKAKRFAKLLVDEIKLYNQGKVTEGREHRDLYDRLKDDIEKSRASYEKRYGATAAKDANYFNQELVRILADNDVSLLGNNFRQ